MPKTWIYIYLCHQNYQSKNISVMDRHQHRLGYPMWVADTGSYGYGYGEPCSVPTTHSVIYHVLCNYFHIINWLIYH